MVSLSATEPIKYTIYEFVTQINKYWTGFLIELVCYRCNYIACQCLYVNKKDKLRSGDFLVDSMLLSMTGFHVTIIYCSLSTCIFLLDKFVI